MRLVTCLGLAALAALLACAAPVRAATLPFDEEFSAGDSGWRANNNQVGSLGWSASGGADGGGYVSTSFNFVSSTAGAQGPVLFRGPASASGGAFVGNWIAQGVAELSFYARTDATVPVNFFARFVWPVGFPGAIAVSFTPVSGLPAGEWTKLTFAISASNPQFVSFEGSDFNTVFSSVGTVQIGVAIPTSLAGVDQAIGFSVDDVAIRAAVPEPSAAALSGAALGLAILAGRRRSVQR